MSFVKPAEIPEETKHNKPKEKEGGHTLKDKE